MVDQTGKTDETPEVGFPTGLGQTERVMLCAFYLNPDLMVDGDDLPLNLFRRGFAVATTDAGDDTTIRLTDKGVVMARRALKGSAILAELAKQPFWMAADKTAAMQWDSHPNTLDKVFANTFGDTTIPEYTPPKDED